MIFDYLLLHGLLNHPLDSQAIHVQLVCSVSSFLIVECSSEKKRDKNLGEGQRNNFSPPFFVFIFCPYFSRFLSLSINSFLQTSHFCCSPFELLYT